MILECSNDKTLKRPLKLSAAVLPKDRAVLHDVAAQNDLIHKTVRNEDGLSQLETCHPTTGGIVSAPQGEDEAEVYRSDLPPISKDWATQQVKYDTRHWIGIFITTPNLEKLGNEDLAEVP